MSAAFTSCCLFLTIVIILETQNSAATDSNHKFPLVCISTQTCVWRAFAALLFLGVFVFGIASSPFQQTISAGNKPSGAGLIL